MTNELNNTVAENCIRIFRNNFLKDNIRLGLLLTPPIDTQTKISTLNEIALECQLQGVDVYLIDIEDSVFEFNCVKKINHIYDLNLKLIISEPSNKNIVLCNDIKIPYNNETTHSTRLLDNLIYYGIPFFGFANKQYISFDINYFN